MRAALIGSCAALPRDAKAWRWRVRVYRAHASADTPVRTRMLLQRAEAVRRRGPTQAATGSAGATPAASASK